jgi:hypothetical protein
MEATPSRARPLPSRKAKPNGGDSANGERIAGNDQDGGESNQSAAGNGGHDQNGGGRSDDYRGDYGDRYSEKHTGKPYGPIRARLLALGYQLAKTFGFTLPGEQEPCFFEDRYELRPRIPPTKERQRKTSRYWHRANGQELNGTGPRRIIFNWPAIMAAGPGATVYISEGANKSVALIEKGLLATAAPYHQWGPECISALAGRHLLYLADHNPDGGDDPGPKYATDAQKKLGLGAASFRIVPTAHLWKYLPPGVRPIRQGDDVKDWLKLGGDSARLLEICREIPATGGATLQSVRASSVTRRGIRWLWPDRFARGKLGVIAGLLTKAKVSYSITLRRGSRALI